MMMQNNRRFDRKTLSLPGRLRIEDEEFDCEIVDLSPGGARVQLNRTFPEETEVSLKLGNLGAYPAQIAWVKRPSIGLRFMSDPEEMAEVILALATYA